MTNKELKQLLTNGFCNPQATVKDAYEEATEILRREGANDAFIQIALGILLTTIASQIETGEAGSK